MRRSDEDNPFTEELQDISIRMERLKLMKLEYDCKILELQYEKMSGDLVDADGVKKGISSMLASIKANVLRIPSEFSRLCPDVEQQYIDTLFDIVNNSLKELSEKLDV